MLRNYLAHTTRIDVEVFTRDFRATGKIDSRLPRVIDLLNDSNESFLLIEPAQTTSLWGRFDQRTQTPSMRINKANMIFAIPHDDEQPDESRQQKRLYSYVRKQEYTIILAVPNYEIRGNVHITGDLTLRELHQLLPNPFIPLTKATVTFLPNPRIAFNSEIVVVNKNNAEFYAIV